MAPSVARGGPLPVWTPDLITDALRRYAALYGDDYTSAAFNPSVAKWRDELELIDRYYAGDPNTGTSWPSLNAIKSHFSGSFNRAREAAGHKPNKPGPASRRRAAGAHRPVRDVSHVGATRTVYRDRIPDDGQIARLQRALARSEARLERAEAAAARARTRKPAPAKPITKTTTKVVRVKDDAAVRRAVDRADRATLRADEKVASARAAELAARARSDEANRTTTRIASKLERSEATITDLRAERRELTTAVRRAEVDAEAARSELIAAREEVDAIRAAQRTIVKDAPEQAIIDGALAEARTARQVAHSAELRAAEAERAYREVAAAATGEARRLTKTELDELRKSGPAGPALLGAALKQLATARRDGGSEAMRTALTVLASAAVSWRERL